MPTSEFGSSTKEPSPALLDATLALITPGMTYAQLRELAKTKTHDAAPALLKRRFLTVDDGGRIRYDGLLSLIKMYGISAPHVRKVMYFVWAWRDRRIREFIVKLVADETGRWSAERLLTKDNWRFFEQFVAASSARKTRSNFEKFLVDGGILNKEKRTIDLDPSDGWLSDAMTIVAHEERDAAKRAAMIKDPVGFLFANGLNALANLSLDDGAKNVRGELDSLDWLDDSRILTASDAKQLQGKKWVLRDLEANGGKKQVSIDLVSIERATAAHHNLERIAADAIKARGYTPKYTVNIDMYYQPPGQTVLLEMKSCHEGNIHAQTRRGVSQLLEYRYLHKKEFGDNTTLTLVLETAPEAGKGWLTDYLSEIGVTPSWKHPSDDVLITSAKIPSALKGVIHPTG